METRALLSEVPLPWQQHQWRRLLRQHQDNKLAHAWLFSGPAGTGKFLLAYRFASYLLCQSPHQERPCGHCRNCQAGGNAYHPDILVVEPLSGSRDIRIEQIRALFEFATRTSHAGASKVIILDQAHRLNTAAANALLKTLEEPGRHTCLILVSDLPGFLPATIRSRCQRLKFPTPKLDLAERWLRRQITEEIDLTALLAVADCRPLRALAMAETDVVADRQTFMQGLARLVANDESPLSLVSQGVSLGELTAVEYLLAASTILLKALLSESSEAAEHNGLGVLYSALHDRAGQKAVGQQLLCFHEEASEARRQLLSGANPNAQLVLESLLWRWSRLLAD